MNDLLNYCPNCHSEIEPGSSFCITCGQPVDGFAAAPPQFESMDNGIVCRCGTVNDSDSRFCITCGQPLDVEEPAEYIENMETAYGGITCSCGMVNDADASYCIGCGKHLDNISDNNDASAEEVCPSCGAPVEPDAFFCTECAARLDRRNVATERCSRCGGIINPETGICGVCGYESAIPCPYPTSDELKKDVSGGVTSTVRVTDKCESERAEQIERAKKNFKVAKEFDV
ncbi:MAG: zinc ribbon domain-containing protein [Ruminococcus sp.]